MFTVKKQLTNTRPAKSTNPSITTSPTHSTMRLSPAGADAMDIVGEDYIAVVVGEDEEGEAFYAVKGAAGVEGASNFGSKVAGSNGKKSGTLQFSSANTYNSLEGRSEGSQEWLLDIENPVEDEEGKMYFKLSKGEFKAKAVRTGDAEEEGAE